MSAFKTEMDMFFSRNCYTQEERSRVQACREYRLAEDNNDLIYAQEVAMQIAEGKISERHE
ncbi:MAG TPA: hypothetical protein VFE51_14095 [Verrucomicrobiae bacterium]|nr:hypothetical protein [Verrucomicrobiae bacterium]